MKYNNSILSNSLSDDSEKIGFDTLYPALVEIFGIIAVGYISGRFKIFTDEQISGIGKFLGTFALPMMIFGSLAKVDLMTVNWTFWLAIFVTKSIIFFLVLVIHAFTNWGKPIGGSALYGIFVTQSNDFALGLPILNALFLTSHPEYPDYLFLLAPISLAILNPIGLIIIDISNRRRKHGKSVEDESNGSSSIDGSTSVSNVSIQCECADGKDLEKDNEIRHENSNAMKQAMRRLSRTASWISNSDDDGTSSENSNTETPMWRTVQSIGCGIFFNPIIFFTIAGLIFGTFVFGGEVPDAINDFVETIGNSFAALALFSLGLAMVGKMERFKEGSNLILPLMLVLIKTVLMPIVAFGTTTLMNPGANETETAEWADFAFIYGTFPTAPTVYVFAAKYDLSPDMIASSMVVCTIISAPLTFVSAQLMAAKHFVYSEYEESLDNLVYGLCIASLVGVIWTIINFFRNLNRIRYLPHSQTLVLLIFQMVASIGGLLYSCVDKSNPVIEEAWYRYLMYFVYMVGQYGTCINTALLGIALYMITSHDTKFVLKISVYLNIVGIVVPCILGGVILAVKNDEIFKDGIGSYPVFAFDDEHYIVIGLLTTSILITMVCLIITQRQYKKNRACREISLDEHVQKKTEMDAKLAKILPEMDIQSCNECDWKNKEIVCRFKVGSWVFNHNCQIIRHTVLQICLTFCMLVGLGFCLVSVFMGPNKDDTEEDMDATYIGMVFLDAVFVGGKGCILFAVFGLEYETVIKPFVTWCKTAKSLYSKPPKDNKDDTRLNHWTLRLMLRIFIFIKKI